MKHADRIHFYGTTALWIVAACMTGCKQKESDNRFSGTIEITEHSLSPRVTGKLMTLDVQENDRVTAGQRIAVLERFQQASRELARLEALQKNGGVSRQTLEQAQLAKDDQAIVSPISGVVILKIHEVGEVVQAGSPVVVVGNPKDMWIRIFVPESLINHVQTGQKATIRLDGRTEVLNGHVGSVAPAAEFTPRNVQSPEERVTQTFAVKVYLDQPPDYLRPGVAADVSLGDAPSHP